MTTEKERERKRLYYLKNKERIKRRCKKYYINNREKCIEQRRGYAKNHRPQKRLSLNKWRKANPDKTKAYRAKSQQNPLTKIRFNKYRRSKWKSDPKYKLISSARCRINAALKFNIKSLSTKNLLGCSVEFLKSHLESKFQPGMTWENYGFKGWHVDHIKPCASFDLTNAEQQKICFNYTNLQPLWWQENLKKSDNIS